MKNLTFILVAAMLTNAVNAEKPFYGSFLMTFSSEQSSSDYPLVWNIEKSPGKRMGIEILDEMIKEGVSKRIIFSRSDSTWTMTIGYNLVKQGTRIHAAAMYRDSVHPGEIIFHESSEIKKIEIYKCRKVIIETSKYIAEAWVTDQLNYDICYIYKLLAHCGLLSKYVQKGEWYFLKDLHGMILEIKSTKKFTGEFYTMKISNIKRGQINEKFFDTSGYRISDIPEGQNCGIVADDD